MLILLSVVRFLSLVPLALQRWLLVSLLRRWCQIFVTRV